MKRITIALALCTLPFSAFTDDGYANQKFSVGSTRCDCPSVKIDYMHYASGEYGQVTALVFRAAHHVLRCLRRYALVLTPQSACTSHARNCQRDLDPARLNCRSLAGSQAMVS
jgi:hypothetical protein